MKDLETRSILEHKRQICKLEKRILEEFSENYKKKTADGFKCEHDFPRTMCGHGDSYISGPCGKCGLPSSALPSGGRVEVDYRTVTAGADAFASDLLFKLNDTVIFSKAKGDN